MTNPSSDSVMASSCPHSALANPKSRILAWPEAEIMTFSVLRSRWRIPLAWASANPSATCSPQRSVSATSSGPVRSI